MDSNDSSFDSWHSIGNTMSAKIHILEALPKIFSINQIAESLKCNILRDQGDFLLVDKHQSFV